MAESPMLHSFTEVTNPRDAEGRIYEWFRREIRSLMGVPAAPVAIFSLIKALVRFTVACEARELLCV
jgi:hypothetical protein